MYVWVLHTEHISLEMSSNWSVCLCSCLCLCLYLCLFGCGWLVEASEKIFRYFDWFICYLMADCCSKCISAMKFLLKRDFIFQQIFIYINKYIDICIQKELLEILKKPDWHRCPERSGLWTMISKAPSAHTKAFFITPCLDGVHYQIRCVMYKSLVW